MRRCVSAFATLALVCVAGAAAQWNPSAGQWGKNDAADLRVMQWNVQDGICRTEPKIESSTGSWCAIARVVAALKPDVLLLQETGDNSGNGTGSGVDSVAQLTTVLNLFVNGGTDPYLGGAVTSYLKAYDPSYSLPYIYVSTADDGFNRNVVLSRYPFADLNGDGVSVIPNIPFIPATSYAPGGNGGIRGFIFAEIDLPNTVYRGNLVVGCAHLKSGSATSDINERNVASRSVAYYIDAIFNGLGTSTPDPNSRVPDSPQVTSVLDAYTPVIWGGDWNEDENTNGRDGPALWMTRAQNAGVPPVATDGTDRDRSDSTFDDSRVVFNSSDRSTQSSSKLDYIAWQDSIATLRQSFIFRSNNVPTASRPPEIVTGYLGNPLLITGTASDHRPVIADFILPAPVTTPGAFALASPADGAANLDFTPSLSWAASSGAATYTVTISTQSDLSSPILTQAGLVAPSFNVPAGLLAGCGQYYWGVWAVNGSGATASTPTSRSFSVRNVADLNSDGFVDDGDFVIFAACYDQFIAAGGCEDADFNADGFVDDTDFVAFAAQYDAFTCP